MNEEVGEPPSKMERSKEKAPEEIVILKEKKQGKRKINFKW